jgi:hypothetical protein
MKIYEISVENVAETGIGRTFPFWSPDIEAAWR